MVMNPVLKNAVLLAKERGYDICIASTSGETALALLDAAAECNFEGKIIVVRNVAGSFPSGGTGMPEAAFDAIRRRAEVVTAAHALSGAERGISAKFKGAYPVEIVAAALRMLSQGVKVCVEIALMANDAGLVSYRSPIVCIGGSGRGADTVCVITPGFSASIFDTKIHEIIEKPDFYE